MNPKYFSKRTSWDFNLNPITTLQKKLQKENIEIVDLTVSNPTKCQFSFYNQELLDSLSDSKSLAYEPSAQGLLSVRHYLSDHLCQGVQPENIFLTASTSEAYSYLFRLLCDKDDEVLFPAPSYPLFSFLAELNDVKMSYYSLLYQDQWKIDFNDLESKITSRTKAIALVNPNNPTGSYIKEEEMVQINVLCMKYGLAIICDEVFYHYPVEGADDAVSFTGNKKALTFVLNGLSKELALPQMKLAWIAVSAENELAIEACRRLDVIADTYLSVSAPVQNAFLQWTHKRLEIQKEIRKRCTDNYQYLKQVLGQESVLKAEGGWYAVIKIPQELSEEDFCLKLLKDHHVFAHPGYFFDFNEEGYLVISLLLSRTDFKKGIDVLLKMSANS